MNLKALGLVGALVLVIASGVYYKQKQAEQTVLPSPSGVQVPDSPVLPSVSAALSENQSGAAVDSAASSVTTHNLGQLAPRGELAAQVQTQSGPITPLPTFPAPGGDGQPPAPVPPPGSGAYPAPPVPPPAPAPGGGYGRVFGQVFVNDAVARQAVPASGQQVQLLGFGSTTTNEAGAFVFDLVPSGYYQLAVNNIYINMSAPDKQVIVLPGTSTFVSVFPQQEILLPVGVRIYFNKVGGFRQIPQSDIKAVLHLYQAENQLGNPDFNQTLGAFGVNEVILGRPGPIPLSSVDFIFYLPMKRYKIDFEVVTIGGDPGDPCVYAVWGDSHPDQEGQFSFELGNYPNPDVEIDTIGFPSPPRLCSGYWQEIARNW